MQSVIRFVLLSTVASAVLLAGCGSSTTTTRQNTPKNSGASFSNFLVAAVADNYTNRAQYERTVVSGLRKRGAAATAYYEAVGGNEPITRESVRELVADDGYDAVLITRVVGAESSVAVKQGSTAAKVTRREGRPLDFFRYDYEEMDEPGSFEVTAAATLVIDLYSAADEKKVWSLEISESGTNNVGAFIDSAAARIVKELAANDLIGR